MTLAGPHATEADDTPDGKHKEVRDASMTTIRETDKFKQIPDALAVRKQIWYEALGIIAEVPRKRPMSRVEYLKAGECLLTSLGLAEGYLGYAMVMLNNAFWLDQFLARPIETRLLLLPRCLANLTEVLDCAERLGYRIHVADGSPLVVRIISEGKMDALLGVGCLESLEKAFDKVRQVGIPSIAVPLNDCGCKDTTVDTEFLVWFLNTMGPREAETTRNYFPLLRTAHRLFEERELRRLLEPFCDMEEETTRAAVDWLRLGGKRLRPFVTLASFKAAAGSDEPPESVGRIALAIELFHKASLVHDDIEDDDEQRYDAPTLHRHYGLPVAINVGDHLLGLGYQLVGAAAGACGGAAGARLFNLFADAHVKLTLGQGMELLWTRRHLKDAEPCALTLADVLRAYTLKTGPAFEAAISSGLTLGGADESIHETVRTFSKHVGAAYQIQNDLDGWQADAAHTRPNALLALALETCTPEEADRLLATRDTEEVEPIYVAHGVFDRAALLIDRLRRHALDTANSDLPEGLSDLLYFLVETIL